MAIAVSRDDDSFGRAPGASQSDKLAVQTAHSIDDKPDITTKRRTCRPAQNDTAKAPKRPNSGTRPYSK